MTRRREIFTGMGIEFKLNTEVGRDADFRMAVKHHRLDAVTGQDVGTGEARRASADDSAFKLEKEVMTRRREIFTGMGIEFKLNTEVGRDVQLAGRRFPDGGQTPPP
jgi:NADPH-dependent glutamate synthase beta subunit-like oxidoreductase